MVGEEAEDEEKGPELLATRGDSKFAPPLRLRLLWLKDEEASSWLE